MTDFTRRKVLGVSVGTMAGAVTALGSIQPAVAQDDAADLGHFVDVSAALTGIDPKKLAPDPDPIKIKVQYFNQARKDPGFESLMQIARSAQNPAAAAESIMTSPDIGISSLGRSIILAWYLGTWYSPNAMRGPQPSQRVFADTVVSGEAYTQGWVWRVAQAHPMGYSELRFGHWSLPPQPLDVFIKS